MRWDVLAFVMVLLVAGCLEGPIGPAAESVDAAGTPGAAPDAEAETVERTFTYSASTPMLGVSESQSFRFGTLPVPSGVESVTLHGEWGVPANAFTLQVEARDGTTHRLGPSGPGETEISGTLTGIAPGAATLRAVNDGVVVQDELSLTVVVVSRTVTADAGPDAGAVRVEQRDGRWVASVTYAASGAVDNRVDAEVRMVNGGVTVDTGDRDARVEVTAWARGDTEREARDRVLSIVVDVSVTASRVAAVASADDWEDRGASARATVPADTLVRGRLGASNGGVTLDGVRGQGLVSSTVNGAIRGSVTMVGDVSFKTTNGPVDVALTPVASGAVTATTTNGGVTLTLAESGDIAYRVDASTTNGRLTASMREASLEGDGRSGTLVTRDGDGRTVQVRGSASTTNGNVHFAGR